MTRKQTLFPQSLERFRKPAQRCFQSNAAHAISKHHAQATTEAAMGPSCYVGFELRIGHAGALELMGMAILPTHDLEPEVCATYIDTLACTTETIRQKPNAHLLSLPTLQRWKDRLPPVQSVTLSLPVKWSVQRTFWLPKALTHPLDDRSDCSLLNRVCSRIQGLWRRQTHLEAPPPDTQQGFLSPTIHRYDTSVLLSLKALFQFAHFPLMVVESFPFSLRRLMRQGCDPTKPLLYATASACGLLACAPANQPFEYCWLSEEQLEGSQQGSPMIFPRILPGWLNATHFLVNDEASFTQQLWSRLTAQSSTQSKLCPNPNLEPIAGVPYLNAYGAALNGYSV